MVSSNQSPRTQRDDDPAEYSLMDLSMKDIRSAMPPHLFIRKTWLGLLYAGRDLTVTAFLWKAATYIDPICQGHYMRSVLAPGGAEVIRWSLWATYWWFQGLSFTSLWVIGHECGHGALSPSRILCDTLGYILHTALWTPYFSWKFSHRLHHSYNGSMEKDEIFIPKLRSEIHVHADGHRSIDYKEYIGDTPLYTCIMLICQQSIGFPLYLVFNISGQPRYPKWTSHLNPSSVIFARWHRNSVMLSNAGILFMAGIVMFFKETYGTAALWKYYVIPWMAVTHWVTMITYLQHTDPKLPRFRMSKWTFTRGATCTVDRNFLGWQGRFFFHDAAHYHVVHHFFPQMPFYNCAEGTKHLKSLIGEHYNYSDAPIFKTLWRNYKVCQFVEDEGEVLFYKDRQGKVAREVAVENVTAHMDGL